MYALYEKANKKLFFKENNIWKGRYRHIDIVTPYK